MTRIPDLPDGWPSVTEQPGYVRRVKTSGIAIASLVCGLLSVGTCCTFVPGVLAVTFGAIALPLIRRQEAGGYGLAVGGIALGALGLILGVVFWVVLANSLDPVPVGGSELGAADRAILEELKVVGADEQIALVYSDGMFSIREGGVVLTADRIVTYDETGAGQSLPIEDVTAVSFTSGANWLKQGDFIVEGDDGRLLIFSIDSWDEGDQLFHRTLRQLVAKARETAGKPPVESRLSSEAAEPNAP